MTSAWLTQRNVDPALLCSEPVGTSLPTRQLTRNTAALGQCICRATALWTLFYGSNGPTPGGHRKCSTYGHPNCPTRPGVI